MRICMASHNQPFAGGGGIFLHSLANEFVKQGHQVFVLHNETPFIHSVKVSSPPDALYQIVWVRGSNLPLVWHSIISAYQELIHKGTIDIFAPEFKACPPSMPQLCQNHLSKLVLLAWGYPEQGNWVASADRIIADSVVIQKALALKYKIDQQVIDVVHGGARDIFFVDEAMMVQRWADFKSPIAKLLFFGRFSGEGKGLFDLLKGVKLLKDEGITNFNLKIIGFGPAEDAIRKTVVTFGLESLVTILVGWMDAKELISHLLQTHLCVLPSRVEGNLLSGYEAAATGVPLIITPNAAPPFMRHNETGIFVPEMDSVAIKEAIKYALSDVAFLRRISEKARCMMVKDHTWKRSAEKHLMIFQSALEE